MKNSVMYSPRSFGFVLLAASTIAACGGSDTEPTEVPSAFVLTTGQVKSLDSTAQVIVQANPGNGTLKSLVDSTLLVLTAGVTAKKLSVSTDLTAAPLY